jgi:uncharacterized integral membrane protein
MWLRWRCWSFDVPLVLNVNIKNLVAEGGGEILTSRIGFARIEEVKRRVRRRVKKVVKVRMMDF